MFKIFSKKSKNTEEKKSELATSLKQKSQDLSNFVGDKIKLAQDEVVTIRKKCSNLLETNYQLGLKHLENDNLSEAIFRFRFINKFWPNHLESYYQLAYCLILANKFDKAKKVLNKLVAKDPEYMEDAQELLKSIENSSDTISTQNNQ
ncbi:MAG: tetratricopeptide repeat protein [Rickettsiales bacterium]|nr:tetratricopeptide repeat protein [Rickettsiales bacterium]